MGQLIKNLKICMTGKKIDFKADIVIAHDVE